MEHLIEPPKIDRLFSQPFSFAAVGMEVNKAVSPFVTLKREDQLLFIRCVVFTDADFVESPTVKTCELGAQGTDQANEFQISIEYLSLNAEPEGYVAWIIEINVDLSSILVNTVCTNLINKDPVTSRGTYTIVPDGGKNSPQSS